PRLRPRSLRRGAGIVRPSARRVPSQVRVSAPPRPSPFALLFGTLAPGRFPALRAALEAAGSPPEDRERFLLLREVAELLRELRPEEGVGEAVQALVALLHASYLFWAAG